MKITYVIALIQDTIMVFLIDTSYDIIHLYNYILAENGGTILNEGEISENHPLLLENYVFEQKSIGVYNFNYDENYRQSISQKISFFVDESENFTKNCAIRQWKLLLDESVVECYEYLLVIM